ncbi:uncharacterized protein LOC131936961 [Physella acuta]|uniref:uncharacterized protein LOC131936961 n=1 Tax=Physella acuta TaxID=109671 RepID=UPI0027DD52C7|nr:uncharacterized protein LOC131936961 [Physella acuta]
MTSKIFLAVLLLTCVSHTQALCAAYPHETSQREIIETIRPCYDKCVANYLCFSYWYFVEENVCLLRILNGTSLNVDDNSYSNHEGYIACSNRSPKCETYDEGQETFSVTASNHKDCFMTCLNHGRCLKYTYFKSNKYCQLQVSTGSRIDVESFRVYLFCTGQ